MNAPPDYSIAFLGLSLAASACQGVEELIRPDCTCGDHSEGECEPCQLWRLQEEATGILYSVKQFVANVEGSARHPKLIRELCDLIAKSSFDVSAIKLAKAIYRALCDKKPSDAAKNRLATGGKVALAMLTPSAN